MKALATILLISAACTMAMSQQAQVAAPTPVSFDREQSEQMIKWLADLYEVGVTYEADSMVVSTEAQNLLTNTELRELMYPEEYSWETTLGLMSQMQLKRAFWQMINLFPDNKELVIKTMVQYDKILEVDRALVGTFYTYTFADPEIVDIQGNQPQIMRPDVLEDKLDDLNEMINYVLYFRELRNEQG